MISILGSSVLRRWRHHEFTSYDANLHCIDKHGRQIRDQAERVKYCNTIDRLCAMRGLDDRVAADPGLMRSTSFQGVTVASGTTPKTWFTPSYLAHFSEAVTVRKALLFAVGIKVFLTGPTATISRTIVVTILCIRDLRDSSGLSPRPISMGSPRDRLSGGVAHCRRTMGDEEIIPAKSLTRKSDLKTVTPSDSMRLSDFTRISGRRPQQDEDRPSITTIRYRHQT